MVKIVITTVILSNSTAKKSKSHKFVKKFDWDQSSIRIIVQNVIKRSLNTFGVNKILVTFFWQFGGGEAP